MRLHRIAPWRSGSTSQQVALLWGASVAIIAYGAWAISPESDHPLIALDHNGLELAHALRATALDELMVTVTWVGSLWLLLPGTLLACLVLMYLQHRRDALFIMLALLGATLFSHLTKLLVMRPRPDLFPLLTSLPHDWSYPSAHTMQATAIGVMIVLLASRHRLLWGAAAAILVFLVGLSRIYLQVHFPSDVIIGTLAAALWVAGLHVLMHAPRPSNLVQPNGATR